MLALTLAVVAGACSHTTTGTNPPPPPPTVTAVTIAPVSDSVAVGKTVQLTATAKDAAGTVVPSTFTWTSSSNSVATVNGSGLVTGVATGSASITASVGSVKGSATIKVTATASSSIDHVFLVVLENRNYDSVIGRSAWPYLNGLVAQGGLATQYHSVTHPSIGNYFMLSVGDTISNDDNFSTIINVDNVVRRLVAGGKTWTSYAENLPNVGYIGGDQGTYTRHHNPFTFLSDVANSTSERQHLQPFTQFGADLAASRFTNYVFIAPNSCNDGHDCSDNTVDTWLRTNIDPLLKSAIFNQNSLLIITFDESFSYGGTENGHVPWIVLGPKVKRGHTSSAAYTHASTLRMTLEALGLSGFPGAASGSPSMKEFLNP